MPDPIQPAAPTPQPQEPAAPVAPTPAAAPTPLGDVSPAPAQPAAPGTPPAADPANPNPPAPAAAGNWGDDWREKLVGDTTTDEGKKRLQQLQRLADPQALYEKLINQEKLISSGQMKKGLPENPTDTELAAWRQENDVPTETSQYLEGLELDDGMVMGEEDKPIVEAVLADLHAANMPKGMAKVMLNSYFKLQQQQVADRDLKDVEYRDATAAELRQVWGGDYTPNLNLVKNLIGQAPQEAQEGILNARMPDGRPLLSHPGALRWLATAARQINPVATVVPGSADPSAAINTELATLKGMMGDKNSEYWKGPNADKNQARYRELLEAQNRYSSK